MKKCSCVRVCRCEAPLPTILLLLLLSSSACQGLRSIATHHHRHLGLASSIDVPSLGSSQALGAREEDQGCRISKKPAGNDVEMDVYATGSSLPDCSHACGPCFPCKRVMVSFEHIAESCPVVYRCMCRGRYYHVPSN